jgi:hypothetical protein
MTVSRRRRPSRNLQRRIRARQSWAKEPYMEAAHKTMTEMAKGHRYLADPAVPAELAAEIRAAGFIPLEPFTMSTKDWWCRCWRCGKVVDVWPGHRPILRNGHDDRDCGVWLTNSYPWGIEHPSKASR